MSREVLDLVNLLDWVSQLDSDFLEYVQNNYTWKLKTLWKRCPRGAWLLEMHEMLGLPWEDRSEITYEIADRAVRAIAPRAFSVHWLKNIGSSLRNLRKLKDRDSIQSALHTLNNAIDESSLHVFGEFTEKSDNAVRVAEEAKEACISALRCGASDAAEHAVSALEWIDIDAGEREHRFHAKMIRNEITWSSIEKGLSVPRSQRNEGHRVCWLIKKPIKEKGR